MLNSLKTYVKNRVAQTAWFQAQIKAARTADFEPYVKQLDIEGIDGRFLFATPQAKAWYDPLKPYAKLEYEWLVEKVPLKGQKIVDAGAHHGQYSVVLALAAQRDCELVSIDPFPMNCLLTELNLRLNDCDARIEQCAVAVEDGEVQFANVSNGRIVDHGGMTVTARTLQTLMPDADVVKLDVEGAEYQILPTAIEELSNVHTWIIEIHPLGNPHPNELIELLSARDYDVFYVDRDKNIVELYDFDTQWDIHSTIFARSR